MEASLSTFTIKYKFNLYVCLKKHYATTSKIITSVVFPHKKKKKKDNLFFFLFLYSFLSFCFSIYSLLHADTLNFISGNTYVNYIDSK